MRDDLTKSINLTLEQQVVLFVYSLYTIEEEYTYLQYTASCALMFHLVKLGFIKYNLDELVHYDYLDKRKYIWESKKFMEDVNILRDKALLSRARLNSDFGRDVNAHQCTSYGKNYIEKIRQKDSAVKVVFGNIKKELSSSSCNLKKLVLKEGAPYLVGENDKTEISGFIKKFNTKENKKEHEIRYQSFFINT